MSAVYPYNRTHYVCDVDTGVGICSMWIVPLDVVVMNCRMLWCIRAAVTQDTFSTYIKTLLYEGTCAGRIVCECTRLAAVVLCIYLSWRGLSGKEFSNKRLKTIQKRRYFAALFKNERMLSSVFAGTLYITASSQWNAWLSFCKTLLLTCWILVLRHFFLFSINPPPL
jgi:hypothetical protein